jgi:hypothetical protein
MTATPRSQFPEKSAVSAMVVAAMTRRLVSPTITIHHDLDLIEA